MTSKERVLRAIQHQETDRVPFGIFGTSFENEERIRRAVGMATLEAMYRQLGIDVWHFWGPLQYTGRQRYYDGEKADYWGITQAAYDDGDSSHQCPLAETSSVDEVESYQWPSVDDFVCGDFEKRVDAHAEFAVDAGLWAPIFHNVAWLCGFENALANLAVEPEVSKAIIRHITDFWIDYVKKLLECCKGKVDIVQNCNDFGTQSGLIMSAAMFREFFKPELRRLYDVIKSYGAKVMQHSCGAISEIIPDFIEIGADIINPVQVSAKGMDMEALTRKYGAQVTFYGGIDTQHILPEGPIQHIRDTTRETIDLFGQNDGFILGPSQGIEPDIPVEHLLAMFDEGKRGWDA